MTLPSTFPTKYVDRTDAKYGNVPWYHFVLIPGKDGSNIDDFLRSAKELQSALEIKQISDSVPRRSAEGRDLNIDFLKEEFSRIISLNDPDWVAGCDGLFIIHHPIKEEKLTSAMAHLLTSPRSAGRKKLLSVQHAGQSYSLEVELHSNDQMAQDSLIYGLTNPSDPAVVRLVERGREEVIRFLDMYADKETMEWFALASFGGNVAHSLEIPYENIEVSYEPLGKSSYPDFEMSVEGQEWAVEVARVQSGMVSHVEVETRLNKKELDRAFGNHITDARVGGTLNEEVRQKSKRRAECPAYSRHCLLLVDIVEAIGPKGSGTWGGCDLSAFDVVAVVRMDGSIDNIKGQFPIPD